ncbi:hypothetical protein EWM64_g3278, partial [Hericium alpestre]
MTAAEDTEDELKARSVRQVEFYFADSNLPFDKFMWTLHTANPEHWVPISTVASFKRMREFTSKGLPWVVDALRASEELEVDEEGKNVRRRHEVQEPKGQFDRSIYAKGFEAEVPDLQEKLERFFDKYGKINAGSVFVEFSNFETVDAFLKAEPKPSWEGKELLTMTKEAYVEMKIKEKGLTGKSAVAKRDSIMDRKGFNAFRDMKRGKDDGRKGAAKAKPEVYFDFLGTKLRAYEEDGGSVKPDE